MFTWTNKTYGFVSEASVDWSSLATLQSVDSGSNLDIRTVKAIDDGGNGGEVRLLVGNGVTDYLLEHIVVDSGDNLDCSPLSPYTIEGGWALKIQCKGGADIHVVLTGILQAGE